MIQFFRQNKMSKILLKAHSRNAFTFRIKILTHEVVIPRSLFWYHKETQKPIGKQHLNALIVGRKITFRDVTLVRVLSTPFVAAWGKFVCSQRARARGKAENNTT